MKLHEIRGIIALRIGFIAFRLRFVVLRSFVLSFRSVSFHFSFIWYGIVLLLVLYCVFLKTGSLDNANSRVFIN